MSDCIFESLALCRSPNNICNMSTTDLEDSFGDCLFTSLLICENRDSSSNREPLCRKRFVLESLFQNDERISRFAEELVEKSFDNEEIIDLSFLESPQNRTVFIAVCKKICMIINFTEFLPALGTEFPRELTGFGPGDISFVSVNKKRIFYLMLKEPDFLQNVKGTMTYLVEYSLDVRRILSVIKEEKAKMRESISRITEEEERLAKKKFSEMFQILPPEIISNVMTFVYPVEEFNRFTLLSKQFLRFLNEYSIAGDHLKFKVKNWGAFKEHIREFPYVKNVIVENSNYTTIQNQIKIFCVKFPYLVSLSFYSLKNLTIDAIFDILSDVKFLEVFRLKYCEVEAPDPETVTPSTSIPRKELKKLVIGGIKPYNNTTNVLLGIFRRVQKLNHLELDFPGGSVPVPNGMNGRIKLSISLASLCEIKSPDLTGLRIVTGNINFVCAEDDLNQFTSEFGAIERLSLVKFDVAYMPNIWKLLIYAYSGTLQYLDLSQSYSYSAGDGVKEIRSNLLSRIEASEFSLDPLKKLRVFKDMQLPPRDSGIRGRSYYSLFSDIHPNVTAVYLCGYQKSVCKFDFKQLVVVLKSCPYLQILSAPGNNFIWDAKVAQEVQSDHVRNVRKLNLARNHVTLECLAWIMRCFETLTHLNFEGTNLSIEYPVEFEYPINNSLRYLSMVRSFCSLNSYRKLLPRLKSLERISLDTHFTVVWEFRKLVGRLGIETFSEMTHEKFSFL